MWIWVATAELMEWRCGILGTIEERRLISIAAGDIPDDSVQLLVAMIDKDCIERTQSVPVR